MSDKLTHFDGDGKAIMVDVGDKQPSKREALAAGEVRMKPETLQRILDRKVEKGDFFPWPAWPGSWRPNRPQT